MLIKQLNSQNKFIFPGRNKRIYSKSAILETNGDMPEALELGFSGLEIAQKQNLLLETSMCLTQIRNIFYDLNN
jgi:hypothetical protein